MNLLKEFFDRGLTSISDVVSEANKEIAKIDEELKGYNSLILRKSALKTLLRSVGDSVYVGSSAQQDVDPVNIDTDSVIAELSELFKDKDQILKRDLLDKHHSNKNAIFGALNRLNNNNVINLIGVNIAKGKNWEDNI